MDKYISVSSAINYMEQQFSDGTWFNKNIINRALKDMPTEDVKPYLRGYWRWTPASGELYCSCCDKFNPAKIEFNYCPNCGAEMWGSK